MPSPKTIDDFIANADAANKPVLKKMRAILRKAMPKTASEKLAWSMPTYYLEGNLLHFCDFTKHISLFPGSDAVAHFKKDTAKYEGSKGTIQFPLDKPLPAPLITRIAKWCVKRNLASAALKAKKKAQKKKLRKAKG